MGPLVPKHTITPNNERHLVIVRGPIHYEVSRKCVNEESSTECRGYNRQVNRSSQMYVKTWVNID